MRYILLMAIVGLIIITSCQKEIRNYTRGVERKYAPIADAGPDQVITLPLNYANLYGTASDPDNNIASYFWKKISGPDSFTIDYVNIARPRVTNLVEGFYQFELKVTDADGLYDRDTVQVEVRKIVIPPPPPPTVIDSFYLGNVLFYCPDPTGTMPQPDPITGYKSLWIYWESAYGRLFKLVTIKIDTLTEVLAGVWCKEGCSPRCPIRTDYQIERGNSAIFRLPPGTYKWSAENSTDIPDNFLEATPEFINFFRIPHKAEGTITVTSYDQCIIIQVRF